MQLILRLKSNKKTKIKLRNYPELLDQMIQNSCSFPLRGHTWVSSELLGLRAFESLVEGNRGRGCPLYFSRSHL